MNPVNEMITVCHVITGDIWAGAEAQSFSLVRALNRNKLINVEVIVFNSGELYEKIQNENIKVSLVSEDDNNTLEIIYKVYKEIKKCNADIVHAHGFKENFTAGLAARLCSKKVIRTHHGKGMVSGSGIRAYIEKINEKYLTNKIIAVSEDLKKYLVDLGYDEERIKVIHNGVECQKKSSCRSTNLKKLFCTDSHKRVIGIVGRLVPVKNHRCFLDSARATLDRFSNVYFVVVGDGPLMSELREYARVLQIEESVHFAGYVNNVDEYLENFDILSFTSFHEGIPIAMLEAMCIGVPVVATKVGGVSEIIQHEISGLLVPNNDSKALSSAYIQLLSNDKFYNQISINSINEAINVHSLENSVVSTINLYKRTVL